MTTIRHLLGVASLLAAGLVQAAPTVALTSPGNNTLYVAPASIVMAATATPGSGTTIKKVEFYRGTTLIGSDTTAPYNVTWSAVPAGSYSLTAKATDNKKQSTTSAAVNIVVGTPPTVSLTAPVANAIFTAPANIVLSANAADADGSIAKVEFYQGATLIGRVRRLTA